MANATMQALQTHAEKLNQQVAEVNASIKALGNVPDDSPALLEYRKQLRRLNSDLKDVNTTMKDYTRGVKAAGELYRHYAMGNIEDMSIKAIRAGVNGMKKRYDNLKAGGDPGDAEEMRLIEAITTEADVVVKRFKTDYQHVVEEIARGGTVTEQTLKRTRDGLADLMQTAETEAEKNELTNYWQKVGAAIEAVAVENRRLRGEVADREEAMRIAYATDHDGSQQAIHDAEARADAARRENDELRQRLDLKQQQRRELEQEMDINSMQVRSLMDQRDELKAQEKEDRAIRNQRVDDANKELNAARRAAKTQQQAYDEQKQTVEKLRTEVQGLTDDIRKMGEVKAEPKVNTEELTQKQEQLSQKTAELNQQQDKLNGMVGETVTANQRLAKAEQEQTDARNAQAEAKKHEGEAVKKVEDELRGLTDEQLKNGQAYSHLTEEINADTAAMQRNITTEQEATREADRLRSGSIDKMEQALARLRESNRKLDPTIDKEEWERGERAIGQLTLRLEELKKQSAELRREPVLDMMTQRMQSLSTLSRDALQETKKFWETMVAGAEKGSGELADYEQHLKSIALEEQARVREQGREAFAFFQREDYRRTNAADTEEQRKALVAYRDALPADATDQIEAINALLEKHAQFVKEAAGEWMSLEKAMELASKAGTDQFAGSAKDIQLATQSLERQRDTIIATIREKRNLGQATKTEEDQLADLTKKLRSLKFEQDNVNMSQEKMRTLIETPANAVNLDELRAAIKRADGQLRQMQQSLGENSSEYKRFAEQVRNAKNVMKEMEGQAKASATAWEKAFSRLKTYVVMYMGFNEVWQKVTGTARDLMDLSDRMGEVRKTTGFTADEVGRLSDNLTKLDTRTNLTGLMEFSSLAGSVGLKTQEAVQGFTEAANMLSVSLPELGKEASRTLMKIADATGDLEKNGGNVRETLERVGSTVIALRANSAAAAGPITDFVSRVGAVGAQAGISIDQIAALGATVDALGGRVEMSATALSRMIPAIRNNTFEVAQAIGMTEKQLKQMSGIDQMVAVFKALNNSVKNFDMTTEEGMNAAADAVEGMLGRSVSMQDVMKQLNQQGARAGIVFGLLSQNVDTLEKQLKIATDAYRDNTALMEEYNKMNETTAAKWERLKNQLEEAFVSDSIQRGLGSLIDMLRGLVDFITGNVTGVLQGLRTAFLMLAAAATVYRMELGKMIFVESLSGLSNLKKALVGVKDTFLLTAMYTKDYIALKWKLIFAHGAEEKAAIKAKIATLGLDKALTANVWMAVVAAIGMLLLKLYQFNKAAKEAAAETGRFNQQIADEQKALNKLFEPLNRSNMAQEERLKLINEINSKYGKYLGYMLSETSSAIQLADAHALIAKRIREEAYEKRIAEKEAKIQDEHSEDVNAAYTKITERVRGSVRGGASAQEIADVLKGIVDNRLGSIKYAYDDSDNIFKARTNYYLDPKIKQAIDGGIERLIVDGKLSRDNVTLIQKAVYKYTVEAHSQHKDIMDQTSNLRSDLRGVQSAIKVDLANNLNTLVSRVASSVGNAVRNIRQQQQPQQNVPLMLQQPQGQGSGLPSLFGGGQQGGWQAPWQQGSNRETTPQQQMAPKGWKPNIDKKDTEAVRQFVQDQEALRSALNASGNQIDEAQRRVAESWLLTDAELKEYKKIVEKADRGPGGSNHNPYGDYNDRVDPYEQWDANALVARRKEMLERVKALANGADVQAVLSEDKRFMDEATRKGIKNMRDAIAWYNEERLKIQEELDARNLTPTGDWKNPEKGGRSKKKPKTPESEGAIAELDRYYSERKELIEEARANEQMTEAEYNRRLDALEQEHLTKRSELRQTFTSEDKQFIQQFRQWWASVKELDEVSWTAIEAEWIAAWERDRKYNNREAQKDLTAMQAIVVKQLKEIEAIIAKERPFNGITDNLQNNLTKMGLLFKDGVPEDGKFMEENTKRLTFLLKEAENAYSLTFDQLAEDMRKNGLGSWADAIINSENADKEKRALIAQLHEVYDQVQDAIKKEASQVKKQVDIAWNDAILPNGKSMKATYEAAISALGVQQSSVSRANNLIGAGVASERVADRLAIKQLQLQLRMQEHYYNLVRKTGQQRVDDLLREAKLREDEGKTNEAERLRLDAKHAQMSLNLSLAKEETELAKQREEIIARTEETQNRLYTELRSWADLLTSSLQGVFEASHAGDAEYYNERAKLNLTGKGGPGAGTYVVIDDAGTSDAKAHYEYLDERQALERQHEIEIQNAQAEAWRKLMDDINMKMSETITDQLNAMLQNQSIDANTQAVIANTEALWAQLGQTGGQQAPVIDGYRRNAEGFAVDEQGQTIAPVQPVEMPTAEGETPAWKPVWQMTDEERVANQEGIISMWQTYSQAGNEAMAQMSEAIGALPNPVPDPVNLTPESAEVVGENAAAVYNAAADAKIAASDRETQVVVNNSEKQKKAQTDANNQTTKNTQSSFAKMAAAANMYGIAYQTMSNDNLSTAQKFQVFALQAAGQAAISMLTMDLAAGQAKNTVQMPGILGKLLGEMPYPAAIATFAGITALMGGLMALAMSSVTKSKSQIAQVSGTSVGAGRLATGMLTYAEGNVNELTDPASLTPGRQYNVDGADGKTYRARYMGKDAKTHITNGPEFHLVGEAGREAIIDAKTTRLMQMDDTGIWQAIQTLYNGGRVSGFSTRRGKGVRAFAEGNLDDFEEMGGGYDIATDSGGGGLGFDPAALQASLDRNSDVQEALLERLQHPLTVAGTGSNGVVAMYDKLKKEAQRQGVKYI